MNRFEQERLNREKHNTILQLLEEEYLLLHLDGSVSGTQLPDYLINNPSVTLKISRLFRGELEVTSTGLTASLLFGNNYFDCIIPLSCIWGVTSVDGNNIIWPECTPEEILNSIESEAPKAKKSESKKKRHAPHLRRVK